MLSNEISLLIAEINNNMQQMKIEPINIKKINNLFNIIKKKMSNKIIHINNYEKKLIQINTNIICIKCNKIAVYKNQLIDKEYYCWLHAQLI